MGVGGGEGGAGSSHTQGWGGLSQEPRSAASQKQPWHALPAPSAEPRVARVRPGEACSPEHVVVAVDLVAHARGVQDAPVAHHGAADALGAPGSEAGQEQLLLGHWGEAGHHLPHHWNTGASVQSPGRAGGPARPFSRGGGFLSGEVRASCPLPPPRVQPGSPGPRLTGVIELHEAKGRHEVLQAAPLARPKVSGVQEEGEVGQKEVPEPEGFGGSHLHGVRAFLRAGGRVKQGEAGGPGLGWGPGRQQASKPRPLPPRPGPRWSRGLPEKGPFLALETNAFAAVGGTEQPATRVCPVCARVLPRARVPL